MHIPSMEFSSENIHVHTLGIVVDLLRNRLGMSMLLPQEEYHFSIVISNPSFQ